MISASAMFVILIWLIISPSGLEKRYSEKNAGGRREEEEEEGGGGVLHCCRWTNSSVCFVSTTCSTLVLMLKTTFISTTLMLHQVLQPQRSSFNHVKQHLSLRGAVQELKSPECQAMEMCSSHQEPLCSLTKFLSREKKCTEN